MEIRTLLATTAFGILLLGCESLPGKSVLTENAWEVVTLDGKPVIETRKRLTTEFLPDGTLKGCDGINWFHTRYEARGKRLALQGDVESTLMESLDPAIREQATVFWKAIGQTRSFFIGDGDQLLHLCDANRKELATLKKATR